MNASRPLRTVMLGCGAISEFHTASLQRLPERYQLIGVADLDSAKAAAVAERFGAEVNSDSFELLERLRPEVTLVALPHHLHLDYGLAALEGGSHLLMEKPMAVSSRDCRQLIGKADEENRRLMVGHTHQFRPHFRRAAEMIRSGAIGEVRMIFDDAAAYYNFASRPRWFLDAETAGGGALFNLVPHLVDHLLFLNDAPVTEISAQLGKLHPGLDIDTECTALLRFANGVSATVTASVGNRLLETMRFECRIFGSEGSLLLPAFRPEIRCCRGDEVEIIDCSAGTDPIDLEWIELYDGITADRPFLADGRYGERVVRILEVIRQSSETRQSVRNPAI